MNVYRHVRRGSGVGTAGQLGVFLVLLVHGSSTAMAQMPLYVWDGTETFDQAGGAVTGLGDLDGDLFDDVAIGFPEYYDGRVDVRSGQFGTLLHIIADGVWGSFFGFALAPLGDVDGDDVPDLAIGAPASSVFSLVKGQVFVYSGAAGTVLYSLEADALNELYGYALANAGDVDGDSIEDFIVGAPQFFSPSGYARVHSGSDGHTIVTFRGNEDGAGFGHSVAGAGDLDQDGVPDVIVGEPWAQVDGQAPGCATVFSGKDGSSLLTVHGELDLESLGAAVAGAGDVNGDGIPDVVVGSPNFSDSGRVTIWSGADGSLLRNWIGELANSGFGTSVDYVGDLDGDGFDDVIVGAPYEDPDDASIDFEGSGIVRVLSGADGRELRRYRLMQPYAFTGEFGRRVSGRSDVDRDGIRDVIVGAPAWKPQGTGEAKVGRVHVHPGKEAWRDIGFALPATGSWSPGLLGQGELVPGTQFSLSLFGGKANASVTLVVGSTDVFAPLLGGVLVPLPQYLDTTLTTDAMGQLSYVRDWPQSLGSGEPLYFQAWVADAAGPMGYTATNAAVGTTP